MKKHELQTPAILLDLDKLEHNIQSWQALCNENGKELWPMIKTHKHRPCENAAGRRRNRLSLRHIG